MTALLACEKAVIAPKVQSSPQLGGEGSGALPRFYIATGKSDHAVVGIDIGTRYIRAVCIKDGEVQDVGGVVPSSVLSLANGKLSVGHGENQDDPGSLIHSVRTKLGTDWKVALDNGHFTAQQIYATLMYWVKISCAKSQSVPVSKCVITVPVSFTSNQRKLIKEIAEAEGLEVIRLINEPTAAALCYFTEYYEDYGKHLVFTMGGGALGVTAVDFSNGIIEVKASSGEEIGGDDFDQVIVRHLIESSQKESNLNLKLDASTVERFRAHAEQAKKDLSVQPTAYLKITNITLQDPGILNLIGMGNYNLVTSLDRDTYAQLAEPLLVKVRQHIDQVLAEANWTSSEVKQVLMDGGMTYSPLITNLVKESVQAQQTYLCQNFAAAGGAAFQAHLILQDCRNMVVWDTTSLSVLAERNDGSCATVISRNTPLPVRAYHQVQAQNATASAAIFQGNSNRAEDNAHQGDVIVNNCPPASNDSQNIEISIIIDQDGIIEYGARHIGLNVNLTTSVYPAINTVYKNNISDLENFRNLPRDTVFYKHRIERLGRKLNIEADRVFEALHNMGYSTSSIKDGTAIELLLHKLKKRKRA